MVDDYMLDKVLEKIKIIIDIESLMILRYYFKKFCDINDMRY